MEHKLLTRLREEDSPFVPASKEDVAKRKEDAIAAARAKGIIPEDPEAVAIDTQRWDLHSKLQDRLDTLASEHDLIDGMCACDQNAIADAGEDWMPTDLFGDNDYVVKRCLRCGGHVDY